MSDKMKQQLPAQIRFIDGESPPAAKLTAITAQFTHGLRQVEKAIGDLNDANYPYSTDTSERLSPITGWEIGAAAPLIGASRRTLDIVNLARLIGPASNLNPHEYGGQGTVTENIPVGVHEFALRYPTDDSSSAFCSGEAAAVIKRTTASTLDAAGDWLITDDGKVYFVAATSGGTITYSVDATTFGGGTSPQNSSFNTIPDVSQLTSSGLAMAGPDGLGRFTATLPIIHAQQWGENLVSAALGTDDYNYQRQLELPSVLVDNLSAGDIIPEGFLVLKNFSTGEVYSTATYYYNSSTAVKIGGVDLSTAIIAGDTFYLATVGSDITGAIDDLRRKFAHAHDRKWGEPLVDVNGIAGWCTTAGDSGPWTLSNIPGNYAPQYLHRDGWVSGRDLNVNASNSMRGWLAFSNQDGSTFGTTSKDTYGVQFGGGLIAVNRIYRDDENSIVLQSFNDVRLTKGILDHEADITASGITGIKSVGKEVWLNLSTPITFEITTTIPSTDPLRKPYSVNGLLKFDGGSLAGEWWSENTAGDKAFYITAIDSGAFWQWRIRYTGSETGGATFMLTMWFN